MVSAPHSRRIIQMKGSVLDRFTMITLWIGESEESFFQKIVLLIPEAECNVQESVGV